MYEVSAVFSATDNMSSVIQRIGGGLMGLGQNVSQAASEGASGFDLLNTAAEGLALGGLAVVGAAVETGVDQMMEMQASMAGFSARTGMTGAALDQMKGHMDALFDTGLVKNFDEAAQTVQIVEQHVKGINDSNFDTFLKKVAGVAAAWGTDPGGVAYAVGQFQAQFKDMKDPDTALDTITQTAKLAGVPLSTIESTVQRYGPKFAAAGLSGVEMGALIIIGSQLGLGPAGIGGLASAVDTFQKNVANPKPAFTNAMKDMGLGPVLADLKANKITMGQALDDVGDAFQHPKKGADAAKDATAIFGSSVDKIGGADALGKLGGLETAFGGDGNTGIAGAANNATSAVQDTLGGAISKFVDTAKRQVGDFAEDVYDSLKGANWGQAISEIGPDMSKSLTDDFNILSGDATTWLNTTSANISKFDLGGAVHSMTDPVVTFWNKTWDPATGTIGKPVTDTISTITNSLKGADWSGAIHQIIDPIVTWWDGLWGADGSISKWVQDSWNGIVKFVTGMAAAVGAAFGALEKAITDALKPVIDIINNIISGINSLLSFAHMSGIPPIAFGGGSSGGASFKAMGGPLTDGWTVVGEQGPELVYKSGGSAQVYSNSDSKRMIAGGGSSGGGGGNSSGGKQGGGGTTINVSVGTLVGSGGMDELSRIIYRKLQDEARRRGVTQ